MVPGLGLNVVRYNCGACSSNKYLNKTMVESPNIQKSRQMEGYWVDGSSDNPYSSSFDWKEDSNQRNMASMAWQRGVRIVELFSNSPMWWMTNNLNPSGSYQGWQNNLSNNYTNEHARYLKMSQTLDWGFNFTSIELFNKPSANWWISSGTQEGCHFDIYYQSMLIEILQKEMEALDLNSTFVFPTASDENNYTAALTTWLDLSLNAKQILKKVNTHGYEYTVGPRKELHEAVSVVGGKKIWNSEFGDGESSGLNMALSLNLNFNLLKPVVWVYWQALDVPGWGLIEADLNKMEIYGSSLKYYVLCQYTRHIRPGMIILTSQNSSSVVGAYNNSTNNLVIIFVNNSNQNKTMNFDTSFILKPGIYPRWITNFDIKSNIKYQKFVDFKITNTQPEFLVPSNSIITFSIISQTNNL